MATTCYLCESQADTREHVPSRGFFDKLPNDIITVPACKNCNASFAKDEEYFRTVVAAQAFGISEAARRVWTGPIVRSLYRVGFEGLRKRLVGDLVTIEIWDEQKQQMVSLPGVKVEGGRASKIVRKIMRGIYFAECDQKLAEKDLIIFRDADVRLNPESLTRGWKEVDLGEVFRYRCHFDDYGAGIWIEFYRSQWWFALAGKVALNYTKGLNK
jgi:hypothetical protein